METELCPDCHKELQWIESRVVNEIVNGIGEIKGRIIDIYFYCKNCNSNKIKRECLVYPYSTNKRRLKNEKKY